MVPPAYTNCIKGKFGALRDSGELAQALINPTKASIRDECLRLYQERSGQKDRETLASFFGPIQKDEDLFETIERVDLDDLKALHQFFTGKTTNPGYKVVEMMAWLIDFQPRPYDPSVNYEDLAARFTNIKPVEDKMGNQCPGGGDEADITKNYKDEIAMGQVSAESQKQPPKWKTAVIASVATITLGAGGYQLFNKGTNVKQETGSECMYWAGDHYEKGACIQRGGDSVLAPFDANRYRNFRRITDSGQITENSIGKVWYRLKKGKFEFFNMNEKHPVDGRRLNGLTEKSYKKYMASLTK